MMNIKLTDAISCILGQKKPAQWSDRQQKPAGYQLQMTTLEQFTLLQRNT